MKYYNPIVFEFDYERAMREARANLKLVPSEPNLIPFPVSAFMQMAPYAIDAQIRNLIETYGYAQVMDAFTKRFTP